MDRDRNYMYHVLKERAERVPNLVVYPLEPFDGSDPTLFHVTVKDFTLLERLQECPSRPTVCLSFDDTPEMALAELKAFDVDKALKEDEFENYRDVVKQYKGFKENLEYLHDCLKADYFTDLVKFQEKVVNVHNKQDDGTKKKSHWTFYDVLRERVDSASLQDLQDLLKPYGFCMESLRTKDGNTFLGNYVGLLVDSTEQQNENYLSRVLMHGDSGITCREGESYGDIIVNLYHFCETTDFAQRCAYAMDELDKGNTYDGFKYGGAFEGDTTTKFRDIEFAYVALEYQAHALASDIRNFVNHRRLTEEKQLRDLPTLAARAPQYLDFQQKNDTPEIDYSSVKKSGKSKDTVISK